MANSEPVRVAVEIIDKFSDDLNELEARLEKIDGKRLDVSLDIDAGDIEEVEARLEKLEEDLNSTLDIDVRGYAAAKAKKEDLEDDMYSTLHIGVDKERLRGLGNLNGGEGFDPPWGNNGMATLSGLESLDLADDVLDHTLENLRGFEGSSSDYADSLRRFSPEEQDFINEWIINPDVAKAHNRGIPKADRDGWIGPSNWAFGMGEKWGPEPRYPGDKRPVGPGTDFLRGIREMTDSWGDLENVGDNIDVGDFNLGLDTGLGDPNSDRTAAEIDFLRGINRATGRASSLELGDGLFSGAKFGDLEFQAKGFDPDLFFPDGSAGNYPWSFSQRAGRRAGRMFGRARFRAGRIGESVSGGLGAVGNLAREGVDMLTDGDGNRAPVIRNLRENIRKLLPSMHKWYRLIALILPLLITMAGAALGAAAAIGALAMAGAAMAGIGLLGYGDSLSESLRNAQMRAKELKKELFEVFRPVAGVFQPFTEQLFDKIPQVAEKLTDPLKGLEASGYDEFFIDALEGTGNWLARLIDLANELAPEIQAIGGALGRAFGEGLINLLRWATMELYENWDAFARLGAILVDVLIILYNLSKAVSFALSFFKPLFDIFVAISDVLGSRMTSAILAAVAAMFSLYWIGSSVAALMATIKALAIAQAFWSAVTAVGGLMGALGALSGVLSFILAQLLSLNILTGGLLLAAGLIVGGIAYKKLGPGGSASNAPGGRNAPASGFGGPSPAGAGGGMSGGTQINIYGDVGNKEYQRLKDEFPDLYEEERTIDEETRR